VAEKVFPWKTAAMYLEAAPHQAGRIEEWGSKGGAASRGELSISAKLEL